MVEDPTERCTGISMFVSTVALITTKGKDLPHRAGRVNRNTPASSRGAARPCNNYPLFRNASAPYLPKFHKYLQTSRSYQLKRSRMLCLQLVALLPSATRNSGFRISSEWKMLRLKALGEELALPLANYRWIIITMH